MGVTSAMSGAAGDPRSIAVGDRIGRYQITGILGAGGMGTVFMAHDSALDRTVAIKVLAPNAVANPNALSRFIVEARSAAKLSHPNTVPIYEIGQIAGIHYLVLEYVTGGSISSQLERHGAFAPVDATKIVADAARGLAAAHTSGIIHRDIKPANLLISQDGTIKIADFGLAKPSVPVERQLTSEGQILGTPYYMSPEQCESRPADHRSDVYSLGATYYTLLTGKNPYESEGSFVRIMHAHCAGEVLDPCKSNRTIPAACAKIVARASAKRPEDRYQSANEMLNDLDAVLATLSGASGIALPSDRTYSLAVTRLGRATRRQVILAGIMLVVALAGATLWRVRQSRVNSVDGVQPVNSLPLVGAAAAEPIKLGVLNSTTGTMGVSGASAIEATLLAIDEVNTAGGVLGRPVEALVRDTRSNADNFAPEAERLIVDDGVSVIFGCWTSSGRKMVVPIVEKHNALLIYPRLYEGIEESPNVFYLGATPNQQIMPAVEWAHDALEKHRFFLVGSDYVFPRIANEVIKDQLKSLDATAVGEEYRPLGSHEFKSVVAKIVAASPDCILSTIAGDSNIELFRELREAGIDPTKIPTFSFSVGEEELQQLDIALVAGDYAACCYFQSIDTPENDKFVASFRKKFGPQRVVTDTMANAYISVKVWAAAVQEAGSLDTRSVRQAMRGIRIPAPANELRIDPASQHTYKVPRIGRITDVGQFQIVWTAPSLVAPEPYAASRSAEEWRALLHDLYRSWGNRWQEE
jgi:urea transport system substrate-binding protein